MIKKITIVSKTEAATGPDKKGGYWTKYKYETNDGTYYMFDSLEVGKEYEIESYASKGKDGKEYTNWGLLTRTAKNNEKLDELLGLVKWLVKNHPAYVAPRPKPEGDLPY